MLVLLAIVLAAVAAVFYVRSQTREYASTATVQLAATSQQSLQVSNGPNLQLVTGDAAAKAAATSLGRSDPTELVSKIVATYDQTANVVSITATTSPSSAAAPLANAFAKAYVTILRDQANASLQSLETQRNQINAQITKLQAQIQAAPRDTTLKTQLNNAQVLYGTVSTQILEAQIAPAPATLLGAAASASATGTSTPKVVLLSVVIGLLAGCGIALLREQFDKTVRTDGDVEAITGQPLLNRIPYVRAYRRGSSELPVVDTPRSAFAESIRELRTSSAVLLRSTATPVVVITSPAPLDGKSLITANLAASWALSGARVVLIDGDLRRPRIHEFFMAREAGRGESAKGLAEILAGRSATPDEADSLIHDTRVAGLRFLPAGNAQGDPADGLASATMTGVLEQLQSRFDIVIIDAPPVLAVADAAIIAEHAAGVILVVRAKKTDQRELAETIKRLDTSSVPVLGVVLNRATTQVGSAYGSYYRAESHADTSAALATFDEPAEQAVPDGSAESGASAESGVSGAPVESGVAGARYGVLPADEPTAEIDADAATDAGGEPTGGSVPATEPAIESITRPITQSVTRPIVEPIVGVVARRPVIPVRAPEPQIEQPQIEQPQVEAAQVEAAEPEAEQSAAEALIETPEPLVEEAPVEAPEPEAESAATQTPVIQTPVTQTPAIEVPEPTDQPAASDEPVSDEPAQDQPADPPGTETSAPVRRRPKPYRSPED